MPDIPDRTFAVSLFFFRHSHNPLDTRISRIYPDAMPTTRRPRTLQSGVFAEETRLPNTTPETLTRTRGIVVQWYEGGEWIDAAREDLLDRLTDDTSTLPMAVFRTPQSALRFVRRMRGMVHCGELPLWRLTYRLS